MATIQEAAQFNNLAYYVVGRNPDGTAQFKDGTPDNQKVIRCIADVGATSRDRPLWVGKRQ